MTTDAVPFFTNQLLSIFKSYIDNGLTMVKNYQSRFSDNNKKLQNWRIQALDDIDDSLVYLSVNFLEFSFDSFSL